MRVAIVVPGESNGRPLWHHPQFLERERLLLEGFTALGHDATIVCHGPADAPSELPAMFVDRRLLGDRRFWMAQEADVVIVMTWLFGYREVVASAKEAGAFVISRGDSDGLIGVRAHPGATLRHAYYSVPWLMPRLRNGWLWAKKFAYLHREWDRPLLANIEEADATTVETESARDGVIRFLDRSGAAQLAGKIHLAPSPVGEDLCRYPTELSPRERLVYAIGRWQAPEKDVELLNAVLRRYLAADRDARAVIAGSGGESIRSAVGSSRCDYVGYLDRASVLALGATARICLVSSQWEGFHGAAHEAVALGATVVGTPIPAVRSLTMEGRFGTMARSHRTRDLVSALAEEMRLWDEEKRDPGETAAFWRTRLSPRAVASRFAEIAGYPADEPESPSSPAR